MSLSVSSSGLLMSLSASGITSFFSLSNEIVDQMQSQLSMVGSSYRTNSNYNSQQSSQASQRNSHYLPATTSESAVGLHTNMEADQNNDIPVRSSTFVEE